MYWQKFFFTNLTNKANMAEIVPNSCVKEEKKIFFLQTQREGE